MPFARRERRAAVRARILQIGHEKIVPVVYNRMHHWIIMSGAARRRRRQQHMSQKVLVVEDDINIAELLRLYLQKDGFEVSHAADGGKAVEMAKEIHINIILYL